MSNFKITIAKPCSENWENMLPLEQGRFCSSCEKEVVDFTKFSNQDLANWFKNDSHLSCGRLNPLQLDKLITPQSNFSLRRFKPSLIAASLIAFLSFPKLSIAQIKSQQPIFMAENKSKSSAIVEVKGANSIIIIKGKVIDRDDKQALVGLSVLVKDSKIIGTTDSQGNFEIKLDRTKYSKKLTLEFRYLGYETKVLKLNLNRNIPIFIEMKMSTMVLGGLAIIREKSSIEKIKEFFKA